MTYAELVGYLLLFVLVGVGFILVHLLIGKIVRPAKPEREKLTIYECGEPTIGSAWIQFDVRYYVVALLFVIFDVEVAFFFPWAVVFGKANTLARTDLPPAQRAQTISELMPNYPEHKEKHKAVQKLAKATDGQEGDMPLVRQSQKAARQMAVIAFFDLAVFFGVLLVGFAYLWKNGDLNWVRATTSQQPEPVEEPVGLAS
ncbi:MAG: hypothetical protein KatS3mg105_4187 [Gemmatales bacterium]|nr:MAG: hypothetical protein KatS3mg105_4187 [Gemmatales bacterium]